MNNNIDYNFTVSINWTKENNPFIRLRNATNDWQSLIGMLKLRERYAKEGKLNPFSVYTSFWDALKLYPNYLRVQIKSLLR